MPSQFWAYLLPGMALDDLRQTRVFQEIRDEYLQEGKQEGKKEEATNLLLRLIKRKFGNPIGN